MDEFVDTHCHIQSAGLSIGEKVTRELWAREPELSREQLIVRATEAGVTRLICVGCDLEDSQLAVEFVKNQSRCWASVGIHPHEASRYSNQPAQLKAFKELIAMPKVVAIGECGLDYFYTHSPKETQAEILRFQIETALAANLPLIFHVREAFDDFWSIFESYQNIRGVLHSFTDSAKNLERALKHNLAIGVNGIATFTKNVAQQEVYQAIPLSNLVLETDAPFLTPAPYRSTICEPKHVRVTAEFLSKLRGESLEELAAATTSNAQKLFGL